MPLSNIPLLGSPGNWEELEQSFAALQTWLGTLNSNFQAVSSSIAAGDVIAAAALADIPTLGAADAGALYFVTDYNHLIRWSGTTWVFMDGGNRFFAHHAAAPGTGWALCDGNGATYMTVGASLGTASITLPNLSGSPSYLKEGAAYTGSLVVAVTPTAATESTHTHSIGSDGAHTHTVSSHTHSTPAHTHTVSGTTANESAHTHAFSDTSATTSDNVDVTAGPDASVSRFTHTHDVSGTTGTGSAHSHGAGTLGADSGGSGTSGGASPATDSQGAHTHTGATGAGAAHTHTLTDGDHRHLVTLPYFRL